MKNITSYIMLYTSFIKNITRGVRNIIISNISLLEETDVWYDDISDTSNTLFFQGKLRTATLKTESIIHSEVSKHISKNMTWQKEL